MKKTIGIITLIILLGLELMACAGPSTTVQGNTNGNYVNYGLYAEADEWVYFSDIANKHTLTKMRADGSLRTTLGEESVMQSGQSH
jgi:hypothetical protein